MDYLFEIFVVSFVILIVAMIINYYYMKEARNELYKASELIEVLIVKADEEQRRSQLLQIKRHIDTALRYIEKLSH